MSTKPKTPKTPGSKGSKRGETSGRLNKSTASSRSLRSEGSVDSVGSEKDALIPESITELAVAENRAAAAATAKAIEEAQRFRDEFTKVQNGFRSSLEREGTMLSQVRTFEVLALVAS